MQNLNQPSQTNGPHVLLSAVDETGASEAISCSSPGKGSYNLALVQIVGTFDATTKLQGTLDGSNWFDIAMLTLADGITYVNGATAVGGYLGTVAGCKQVRLNCTTYASGNVTGTVSLVA